MSVKHFCEAISTVDHLFTLYHQTAAETGLKDHFLEKKLEKMTKIANDLEDWIASKNPTSLVKIFLKHGMGSVDTSTSLCGVQRLHSLALRTGTLEDAWNRSRLMALYLQSGTLVDSERLFNGAEKKGVILYNQMMTVYSRHAPEKAKRLFHEMMGTCTPDGATYVALLQALSVAGETEEAIEVVRKMGSRGVQPEPRHYGVLVDSFARKMTPSFIKGAIDLLKSFPAAQSEMTINSVLSRCVSLPGVEIFSEEEKADLTETISHAQDLVDYLEEKKIKYAVLDKTHWRLAKLGLKWPRSVTKK